LLAPALWVQLFPPQAVALLLSIALLATPPQPTEFDVGFCKYNFPSGFAAGAAHFSTHLQYLNYIPFNAVSSPPPYESS